MSTITRLRVGNEDFLVAAMIERCPKSMMIRELLQNALEAAQSAPNGERRVEFSALTVDGARKLALWNADLPASTGSPSEALRLGRRWLSHVEALMKR